MPAFTVTYVSATDAAGTFLQSTPSPAVCSVGTFDQIEIVNTAGSDITIEAIPIACSAFKDAGKLMHFKIKDGQSKRFNLRGDLAGAFLAPMDFVPLLWQAKSKNGLVDRTKLIPRSRNHCQIILRP